MALEEPCLVLRAPEGGEKRERRDLFHGVQAYVQCIGGASGWCLLGMCVCLCECGKGGSSYAIMTTAGTIILSPST